MSKKNVLEFITSMGEGGAQALVKDYVLLIDKTKFNIKILCLFPMLDSGPGQAVRNSKVAISSVYPHYSKFWSLVNKFLGWWLVPRKLSAELSTFHPDVIHAHLGVLKYLVLIRKKIPHLLYTCHSEPLKNFKSFSSKEFLSAKRLVAETGLKFIALHADMKAELDSLFDVDNTVVVHNGIDLQRFMKVDSTKVEIRQSLNIPEDAFVVGHVGRFMEAKNHEFIIKVFEEVKKRNSKALLLLIGSGPLKNKVKRVVENLGLANSCIMLEGRNDIEYLLKTMDVFLFPSIYEGLPVSLIEAQVAGLHCVSSSNVSQEAFLTPKLEVLSLDQPVNDWADTVLDLDYEGIYNRDISIYDMKKEIKVLESLYEGSAYGPKRI